MKRLEIDSPLYSKDDPENDPNAHGNPFNTLFVARLSYDLTEEDLMREFEQYGPIRHVSRILNGLSVPRNNHVIYDSYDLFEHQKENRVVMHSLNMSVKKTCEVCH